MLKRLYHYFLALLGVLIFWFPSRQLFVVGVTGTKGKSTTLEIINAILERAGKKTALLSSVRIKIAEKSERNLTDNTMPGRFFIQRFLRKAVKNSCQYALIEVTSQGIIQHRHRFINWSAAIFTNLAPEHIEAHGGFEKYREAKLQFFREVNKISKSHIKNQKLFFINQDDPQSRYFIEAARGGKVILYSKNQLDVFRYKLPINLMGDFNLENIAAAVSFAQTLGIENEIIKQAIEGFIGVPGRMEIVQNEPFKVIIDYAHTPDALEKVYQTIHSKLKSQSSKLICVLGSAGGGRDKWKRPKIGEIAARYCNEIIITNEDPYDEDPLQIIEQIEAGFLRVSNLKSKIYKILNRQEAIQKAIALAQKNDLVIITGKGCEPFMHLENGRKIPWDERKVVEEALHKL